MRQKVAVFMPTLRCPAKCEHCLLTCGPHSGETAASGPFRRWVSEAVDLGFSPVCLTGGEIFSAPALVRAASEICAQRSTPLVLQTNGFWAASPARARETLARIPHVTQIGFSADYAHEQYIPRQSIENGIQAAYERGIDNVTLSISYQKAAEQKELQTYFRSRFPKITIDAWPITLTGRAANNPALHYECPTYTWDYLSRSCEAQQCLTPIVRPNGDVHLCYHLPMCLAKEDPFLLGNVGERPLAELLDEIRDPLYRFILAYGGGSLGYLLAELAPDLLKRKYQRTCELCYQVFAQPKLVATIRSVLAHPEFAHRIDEIVKLRSTDALPASTGVRQRIVVCRGKNCFGAKRQAFLRNYLQNRLIDSGAYRNASIESVDCLRMCKEGPNILVEETGQVIHRADARKIDGLIELLADGVGVRDSGGATRRALRPGRGA